MIFIPSEIAVFLGQRRLKIILITIIIIIIIIKTAITSEKNAFKENFVKKTKLIFYSGAYKMNVIVGRQ